MIVAARCGKTTPALGGCSPRVAADGSEHYGHIAKGSIVTMAYATGIEIIGLCGARIVAHRDYEKFPVCSSCTENVALLRNLKGPGET